jgi:lipopolysaccharide/colanic/teichoic acid biosynthesis glycosyltransferase
MEKVSIEIQSEVTPLLIPLPTRAYERTKRAIDIVGAIVLFILSLPLCLIIFLLIKFESSGPVVIRQQRVGYKGKVFTLYKFRTMYSHVNLYDFAPKHQGDMRITRLGRVLRQTSLDELPQVINILKGEMSLVGPRPEMAHVVASYEPWQHVRFEAIPGLTGLWQISGRKDRPLTENIELDVYYIQNRSIRFDSIILLKTVPTVLFQRGAY